MAKGQAKGSAKGPGGGTKRIINKHLHARVAYLDKIAKYMVSQHIPLDASRQNEDAASTAKSAGDVETDSNVGKQISQLELQTPDRGLAYLYGTHLRAVSLKSQVPLSQEVKRAYCKVCNAPLIPGRTSEMHLENRSKHGKKPWADVQVISCLKCHSDKRYPIGARRQPKKSLRSKPDPNPETGERS